MGPVCVQKGFPPSVPDLSNFHSKDRCAKTVPLMEIGESPEDMSDEETDSSSDEDVLPTNPLQGMDLYTSKTT